MIQPTPNKPYAIRCVHFDGSCRAGKCAIGEFGGTPTCEQCDGCNKREWPNPGPARMPKTSNTAGAGPGDIVAIVLKQMGVKSAGCVKCAMMRKRMNEWKWLGCLWNMKTIVAWFADRARDEGLTADPNNVRALIKAAFKQMRSARPRRIIINCDSHGFGDAIVMAWIAEGAKTSKPIALHATGTKRDLLEMLGQTVVDDPSHAKETFDAYYHQELSVERGSVQRVVSRARAMGIQSDPARPGPIRIPKKNLDWAKTVGREGANEFFGTIATSMRNGLALALGKEMYWEKNGRQPDSRIGSGIPIIGKTIQSIQRGQGAIPGMISDAASAIGYNVSQSSGRNYTDAMRKAKDILSQHTAEQPPEDQQKSADRHALIDSLRAEPDTAKKRQLILDAVKSGKVPGSKTEINGIVSEITKSPLYVAVKELKDEPDELKQVFDLATPAEKEELRPLMAQKIFKGGKNLTDQQKIRAVPWLRK